MRTEGVHRKEEGVGGRVVQKEKDPVRCTVL